MYYVGNQVLDQVYWFYILVLVKVFDLAVMNCLCFNDNLNIVVKWWFVVVYVFIGKMDMAWQMVCSIDCNIGVYQEMGLIFGFRLRDQAMILEMFVLME